MLWFCFVFAGSRTYVAVSRSGLECSIYVNGLLSGHSTAAASVVYRNSDLVFGANHLNNSDYFSGSMDHVAIYSQSFGDANVAAVYAAELASVASSPTAIPSSRGDSSSSSSSSSNQGDSGGCNKYCMIGIIVGIVGAVGTFCGICAAYHIFYMQRQQQRTQNGGNNFDAVATRDATYRIWHMVNKCTRLFLCFRSLILYKINFRIRQLNRCMYARTYTTQDWSICKLINKL